MAMARAEVGDDVWGEDPTVNRLEEDMARRLGKEAAVFVPSGTMGNLACVAAQTRPGDEVIADAQAHLVFYEVGGSAIVAGVQLRILDSVDGVPDALAVTDAVRIVDIHQPVSTLLCIENTHNRRGGGAVDADRVHAAARTAHRLGLRVHCDGARLFNAAVALGVTPAELVDECDTVTVCVSKGLGAPVGSVVSGDTPAIQEVRRWRKRLGGGMRQAGVIAAAGLYALEHNLERLAEDHANARVIAEGVEGNPGCDAAQAGGPHQHRHVRYPGSRRRAGGSHAGRERPGQHDGVAHDALRHPPERRCRRSSPCRRRGRPRVERLSRQLSPSLRGGSSVSR